MDNLELTILGNCSGKTYDSLKQQYGANVINSMLTKGYISVVEGKVVRTEIGLSLSKPMQNPTNEKLGTDGNQLLLDASGYNGEGQLLLS